MTTTELDDNGKILDKKSSISLDMSHENPLQIIADPRFFMILIRAMKRARVAPLLPKEKIRSERSSWSSASAVSTIDLKSPEPDLQNKLTEKLQIIDKKSRNRKILFSLIIFIVLICIGIILSIVLPLVLYKNSSGNNSTDTGSSINES